MTLSTTLAQAVIGLLNYIELSSQFDCLPNGDPVPYTPRIRQFSQILHSERSLPTTSHPTFEVSPSELYPLRSPPKSSDIPIPLAGAYSPEQSPSQPALRLRSRSPTSRSFDTGRFMVPPTRLPSQNGCGYGLEHLKSIRLIPDKNPKRVFELRRYTFPGNSKLRLKMGRITNELMPIREQIVISTSDGDIYAILESSNALAGMYIAYTRRAKMNMRSGTVTALTPNEIAEIPVGRIRPILTYFKVILVQGD